MTSLIAVTPYGRAAPSARVRVYEWLDRLNLEGSVHPYLETENKRALTLLSQPIGAISAAWRARGLAKKRYQTLLLHRQATPFGRGDLEERLLRAADHSVYDFDDALQWGLGRRGPARLLVSEIEICVRCIRRANVVIAGSDTLAEWAGQFAREVVMIPSCVEPRRYVLKEDYAVHDPPRLVWIGSFSGEKYLGSITRELIEVNRRTGARLTIIGSASGNLGELEAIADRIRWREGEAERRLSSFDLGIAPLHDDAFSRGKCAYKLLQYGASGLPFVASPVGANERVATSLGGSVAVSQRDWTECIVEMLSHPEGRRHAAGCRGRQVIESCYSFDAWERCWLAALELVASI